MFGNNATGCQHFTESQCLNPITNSFAYAMRWNYHLHRHGSLQWRLNECDSVSNHQHHDCLLNCLFRRSSRKTSKLLVTGLCAGNSPWTGEFPAQRASNAENLSIWWRHHVSIWNFTTKISPSAILNQSWYVSCDLQLRNTGVRQ